MKFLRPCLLFISIILFGWLLMSNINLINVAESLNESEITSQIKKVNSFSESMGLKSLQSRESIIWKLSKTDFQTML